MNLVKCYREFNSPDSKYYANVIRLLRDRNDKYFGITADIIWFKVYRSVSVYRAVDEALATVWRLR